MSCDCEWSEQPKCMTESRPRARKRHRCCECRGWIEVGEVYDKVTGIWDCPETYRTCPDCEQLRKDVMRAEKCPCFTFGGLSEHASEEPWIRARFVSIMQKRCTKVHESWFRKSWF